MKFLTVAFIVGLATTVTALTFPAPGEPVFPADGVEKRGCSEWMPWLSIDPAEIEGRNVWSWCLKFENFTKTTNESKGFIRNTKSALKSSFQSRCLVPVKFVYLTTITKAEHASVIELSRSRTSDMSLRRVTPPQENPFSFDGGDVTIRVTFNDEVIRGKVVSGCMASASSVCNFPIQDFHDSSYLRGLRANHVHECQVWKMFLYPPWSSEGGGPVKELDFSDDDGEALLVLLRIVHLQFTSVPTSFKGSILPLYNIALLCKQRKAYIVWAFGSVTIFRQLAKNLVLKSRIQANGTLESDDSILPGKLVESVQRIREDTLKKLLAVPYAQATKLRDIQPAFAAMSAVGLMSMPP
ncbi:hypothetical protein BKA65DRAFT_475863 [Rhexocercosporidium sp. MPI-PUGE-AT-0058]|nr:hypothetical protein BKA65DRAFT_475863 [Rhexocercosporidium sp. MPI-PUGE-AT-0058]